MMSRPSEPVNTTWSCHICKEERPDARISVLKHSRTLPGGIQFEENVRYCNDRPDCAAKAVDFHFIPPRSGSSSNG